MPLKRLSIHALKSVFKNFSKERIHAIFVFHDSYDWGRDTQVIVDLLTSNYGYIESSALPNEASQSDIPMQEIEALEAAGANRQIPIYFSSVTYYNFKLLMSFGYPIQEPRFLMEERI
jgi:hypothetical protein